LQFIKVFKFKEVPQSKFKNCVVFVDIECCKLDDDSEKKIKVIGEIYECL